MVSYEWDVETHIYYNESSDIDSMDVLDHEFSESFEEASQKFCVQPEQYPEGVSSKHIVLVRDDDFMRTWAYLDGNKLPEFFMDADGKNQTKVPKKFHKEVEKILTKNPDLVKYLNSKGETNAR